MKKRLTKAEEEIMLVLWKLKEATIREVINKLEDIKVASSTHKEFEKPAKEVFEGMPK